MQILSCTVASVCAALLAILYFRLSRWLGAGGSTSLSEGRQETMCHGNAVGCRAETECQEYWSGSRQPPIVKADLYGLFFFFADCVGVFGSEPSIGGAHFEDKHSSRIDHKEELPSRLLRQLGSLVAARHPVYRCRSSLRATMRRLRHQNFEEIALTAARVSINCLGVRGLSSRTPPFYGYHPSQPTLLRATSGIARPALSEKRRAAFLTWPHFHERLRPLLSRCVKSRAPYPCSLWTLLHMMSLDAGATFMRIVHALMYAGFFACHGCTQHWQRLFAPSRVAPSRRNVYMQCVELPGADFMEDDVACRLANVHAQTLQQCLAQGCIGFVRVKGPQGLFGAVAMRKNWGRCVSIYTPRSYRPELNFEQPVCNATQSSHGMEDAAEMFENSWPVGTDSSRVVAAVERFCGFSGSGSALLIQGLALPTRNCDILASCTLDVRECTLAKTLRRNLTVNGNDAFVTLYEAHIAVSMSRGVLSPSNSAKCVELARMNYMAAKERLA